MVKATGKVGVHQYHGAHPFISNHQAFNGHLHKASTVKNAVEFIAQRCRQTGKQWTEMHSRKEWGLTQGLKHRLETGRNGKRRMREGFTVKTASELSLESWQDVTSTSFQDLSFAPSARLISDFLEQQDQEQQWLKQEVRSRRTCPACLRDFCWCLGCRGGRSFKDQRAIPEAGCPGHPGGQPHIMTEGASLRAPGSR